MKRLSIFMGMVCVLLLSCNPPIEGELTLVVDRLDSESWFSHSPCWSSDGSKVYYLSHGGNESYDHVYQIWSVNLSDMDTQKVIDNSFDIWRMDVSYISNLCVTYSLDIDGELRFFDLENAAYEGAIKCPTQEPKFSLESDSIIYYLGEGGIRRYSLSDSTDEIICNQGSGAVFAPGPGDTLFAREDTVYNINTGEAIPIGIDGEYNYFINWNPAIPEELLISGISDDVFMFNLQTRELTKVDIKDTKPVWTGDARFSPDGSKIAFIVTRGSDGFYHDQIWIFEFPE